MQPDIELTELGRVTSSLAGQPTFRSKAILITRLLPLILAAIEAGHTHKAIYETIVNAGLSMTFTVYRNTLHRVRTRTGATAKPALPHATTTARLGSEEPNSKSASSGSQEPTAETVVIESKQEPDASQTGTSDSAVLDAQKALERADAELAGKDYAKIARQLRRKSNQ